MLETHSTKATAVGESNTRGSGNGAPRHQRLTGVRGRQSPTLRRLYSYFFKNTYF